MNTQKEQKILTREEVKTKLNIATGTLYNWERKKILMPTRIGRRVYYLESDILKLFDNESK